MANYGFESSGDVAYDKKGMPIGLYRVMAIDEEDAPTGIVVTYEILTGKHKGQKKKNWYNTMSDNETTKNIARQDLKRIGDCMGKPVSKTAPVKGRVFVIQVEEQKKNPEFTNITRYYPEDHEVDETPAKEEIPFS